ncbi:MAG: collagen triple helix repeat motif-containing protein [Podoviridae sp. cty5g4]|nr:MAG: collagen triple helix repeat motif-containing protein [Podoviridae sp. cty5g4]
MSDWIAKNKGAGVWSFTKSEDRLKYNEGSSVSVSPLIGGSPVADLTYLDSKNTPITPSHQPNCGYWSKVLLPVDDPGNEDDWTEIVCPLLTEDWTARTTSIHGEWISVAYGNNRFVAVQPDGNKIMYSSDGISWEQIPGMVTNPYAVTYGNGVFIIVARSGLNFAISADGINWTTSAIPINNDWRAIAYGDGMFVVTGVSGAGNRVMTSPDGSNWTLRTSVGDVSWNAVAFGDGRFVAVAAEGWVMTSGDGIGWTLRIPSAFNEWQGIAYGNGRFVAVANHGTFDRVMWSSDGINWTSLWQYSYYNIYNFISQWFAIAYGNGRFVAVGIDGVRIMSSPDGEIWTAELLPSTTPLRGVTFGIVYGSPKFVAVGSSGSGENVMTSTNGVSWATSYTPYGFPAVFIAHNEDAGTFLASNHTMHISSSNDGISWSTKNISSPYVGTSTWYNCNRSGKGRHVLVGFFGYPWGAIAVEDGMGGWVGAAPESMKYQGLEHVAYGNGIYVATSSFATTFFGYPHEPVKIFTSLDNCATWTVTLAPLDIGWGEIAYGNDVFVALSALNGNKSMVSSDGINWTAHDLPDGYKWEAITYGGQKARYFVAVNHNQTNPYRAMVSEDGINWTLRDTSGANQSGDIWSSIAYAESGVKDRLPECCVFVAVGYRVDGFGAVVESRCMYSLDTITWHNITVPQYYPPTPLRSITYGKDKFVAVGTSNGIRDLYTLEYKRYIGSLYD